MYKILNKLTASIVLCLMCLAFGGITASAQTETARLQGTVTDAAGAVIAGATVKATDIGTGRTVETQTNESGEFSILALQPGRYRIEVTQANFKTTQQEITLEVAQQAVLPIALEAGAVTETVTVTTDVPLVESASSAIGATIDGRQAVELPLNGRNVLELARLTPGVTQGVVGGFASGAGGDAETTRGGNVGGAAISVNGQRTQANNYLLDGVDNNESLVNTINIFPSAEAIQEFRVQTSVATAEYGRGGGAIINSVIKSGRNDFYGSAFGFLRNSALDARPAFFNATPTQRTPDFRRSQFGGTIGGPLYLPAFGEGGPVAIGGRDRVFFFVNYDGLRQNLPLSTETATVPTLAFRNGNFSALATQLRDPLTGQNICVNGTTTNGIACTNGNGTSYNRLDLLPGNRLNQVGLNYLRAFPLPNNGTQVTNNFINTRVQNVDQDLFDLRVDGNINDKNQVFVRGSYGRFNQETSSRLFTLPAGFGSGGNPTRNYALVTGLNTSITSNVFNELRLQANRIRYGFVPPFFEQAISASLGIPNANRNDLLGGGALIGGFNGQLEYTGDFGLYNVPQNTYQIVDSISYVAGNHTLKFGGTIVKRNVQLFRPLAGKGDFRMYGNGQFNECPQSRGAAPSETASGATRFEQADLLIGFMCTYDIGFQNGGFGTINWENAVFAQDDWKVNNKLTLNLGLRYEYLTNPSEEYGRQANFNLSTGGLVAAQDDSDNLVNTDKNNFSPRVGFAYNLFGNGKSVIRAGYGIFYFLDRGGISNQLAQNPPFAGSVRYTYNEGYRITLSGQGPRVLNVPPTGSFNPFPSTAATLPLPQFVFTQDFLNNPLNANVIAILPDNKTSNTQQFNIQFQQQLTNSTAISVGYVGTRGRNLSLEYDLNGGFVTIDTSRPCPIVNRARGNCYPGVGSVRVRDFAGKSQYDSLQVQVERRFTRGLQFLGAYTFSKTKDNGEGAFDRATGGINYIEPFGTSRLDFPHVFSFSTVYDIPFGRGRQFGTDIPRALDYIIGGLQLNAIYRAQSGSPFDVRNGNVLVDLVGDPYTGSTTGRFLNRSAFRAVPGGANRLGTLERNSLRSPALNQLNLGLTKNIAFTERFKAQFRAEAFNIFNVTQLGTPDTNFDPNNFNPAISDTNATGGFGTIRGIAPFSNRQLQFGVRLEF